MIRRQITQGAELPELTFEWRDSLRRMVPFAADWTFRLLVAPADDPANLEFTKTTGIAGFNTSPNVVVGFATIGEVNDLDPGDYICELWATRTSDSKDRDPLVFTLRVRRPLGV